MSNRIPKPLHPSPDRVREGWLNLNGEWEFSFDEPSYDRKITVPFSWGAPLSGIGDDRRGIGYYRRTVRYNAENDRLFLIFGAVDYEASVKVNGIEVGSHIGGYSRFECEVTDAWDSYGDNVIELAATDNDEKYQTYGKQGYGNCRGIWQTVWLERRPETYLDSFRIVTKTDGRITVSYTASTPDADGAVAVFDGKEHRGKDGVIEFALENPRLWCPEDPYLYEGELRLGDDCVKTYFGVREVSTGRLDEDGKPYILLNGKPIFLSGVLDQSFNTAGFFTLPTHEEEEEEILRLKRIGINLARIHIKMEEPRKLYYADRHGMLIMEDCPCFWGEPNERARVQFEREMREMIARDFNHPSIIYWVVFNESWGLLSNIDGERVYLPETQEWVRACYREVKALDPTRLVEDNSACRHDHVETDVLTWHFYYNGYETCKKVIDGFCREAVPGATGEYIGDNANGDVPAMNSECGNYWHIADGGAGDSDLSWQYHYMMNEFRLHDRLCGFVFTEFHDVTNEFNGYFRIDSSEKHFGYDGLCPGMTLADLHGPLYLATDCPPMRTLAPGETAEIPLALSCFELESVGRLLNVRWEAVLTDRTGSEAVTDRGIIAFRCKRVGLTEIGKLSLQMPSRPGILTLRLLLTTPEGEVRMRNFLPFDVTGEESKVLRIPTNSLVSEGFTATSLRQGGEKLNGIGAGSMHFTVDKRLIPDYAGGAINLTLEASTRATLTRDLPNGESSDCGSELNALMLGYRVDPGANPNAFPITDEYTNPGSLTVSVEGKELAAVTLDDCPADSRGVLSHHYQADDRRLDEVGSYGYLVSVTIDAETAAALPKTFSVTLTADRGLSVFGRRSGRYPCGIDITAL